MDRSLAPLLQTKEMNHLLITITKESQMGHDNNIPSTAQMRRPRVSGVWVALLCLMTTLSTASAVLAKPGKCSGGDRTYSRLIREHRAHARKVVKMQMQKDPQAKSEFLQLLAQGPKQTWNNLL